MSSSSSINAVITGVSVCSSNIGIHVCFGIYRYVEVFNFEADTYIFRKLGKTIVSCVDYENECEEKAREACKIVKTTDKYLEFIKKSMARLADTAEYYIKRGSHHAIYKDWK